MLKCNALHEYILIKSMLHNDRLNLSFLMNFEMKFKKNLYDLVWVDDIIWKNLW